jgi:hypothetical protein
MGCQAQSLSLRGYGEHLLAPQTARSRDAAAARELFSGSLETNYRNSGLALPETHSETCFLLASKSLHSLPA